MKKTIIWVSVAIALLVLGITLVVRSRRRTAEAEALKKRSNAIADLINERDAKIADLERALNENKPQPAAVVENTNIEDYKQYPQNPIKPTIQQPQVETKLQQEGGEVEVREEKISQLQDKKGKKQQKNAQEKSPRPATEAERVLYGKITHQIEQVSDEEKIKLYEEFLANPIAKTYKGIITKQLNKLRAKMNETV